MKIENMKFTNYSRENPPPAVLRTVSTRSDIPPPRHRLDRMEYSKKLAELHRNQSLTYNEILELLKKEFQGSAIRPPTSVSQLKRDVRDLGLHRYRSRRKTKKDSTETSGIEGGPVIEGDSIMSWKIDKNPIKVEDCLPANGGDMSFDLLPEKVTSELPTVATSTCNELLGPTSPAADVPTTSQSSHSGFFNSDPLALRHTLPDDFPYNLPSALDTAPKSVQTMSQELDFSFTDDAWPPNDGN